MSLCERLRQGCRASLARAITLCESTHPEHGQQVSWSFCLDRTTVACISKFVAVLQLDKALYPIALSDGIFPTSLEQTHDPTNHCRLTITQLISQRWREQSFYFSTLVEELLNSAFLTPFPKCVFRGLVRWQVLVRGTFALSVWERI